MPPSAKRQAHTNRLKREWKIKTPAQQSANARYREQGRLQHGMIFASGVERRRLAETATRNGVSWWVGRTRDELHADAQARFPRLVGPLPRENF